MKFTTVHCFILPINKKMRTVEEEVLVEADVGEEEAEKEDEEVEEVAKEESPSEGSYRLDAHYFVDMKLSAIKLCTCIVWCSELLCMSVLQF